MHKNNKHNAAYDFKLLCTSYPALREFFFTNKYGTETITFSNPKAVKALNTALLNQYYKINYWEFPDTNLCPPIPSRADYIHYLADLDIDNTAETILDIGTGATCIYPLLGNSLFGWQFVATDISEKSLENAQEIIRKNKLENSIKLRKQNRKKNILQGVILPNESFFATMCNPPFYISKDEAEKANNRKQRNLGIKTKSRNFGGNSNELWYKGGELAFIKNYIKESVLFKTQVTWFTSLVSKGENLPKIYQSLDAVNATVKTIDMEHGNKITRIVAWSYE